MAMPLGVYIQIVAKIHWESPESVFYRAIIRLVFGVGG